MNWDWDQLQEKRQRQPRNNKNAGTDRDNDGLFGSSDDDTNSNRPSSAGFGGFSPDPLKRIKDFGANGNKGFFWLAGGLVLLWLLSGIYIINPDEEGIVLRFGKFVRSVGPGPHYCLPYPIESVYKPKVTQVMRSEIGFRSIGKGTTFQQGQARPMPEEAATLTGDENIVNVQFSVQYKIKDAVEYLFNVTDQIAVVRNASEAAMREVIGKSMIDSVLTDGKLKVQSDATELLQQILDRYEVGVMIIAVQLQDVHPPQGVLDAFKDVASAREDKSRIINEAEAYRNELLPKARGLAAEIVNQAQGYREIRILNADGETKRFLSVLAEYDKAKDVTKKRLYFEAIEEILSNADTEKLVLPKGALDKMLPFLPLERAKVAPAKGKAGEAE